MINHKDISKKKIWSFQTFEVEEKIKSNFEINEEIFNLKLEINQLKVQFQDSNDGKERIKLHKRIKSKIGEIKNLYSVLTAKQGSNPK